MPQNPDRDRKITRILSFLGVAPELLEGARTRCDRFSDAEIDRHHRDVENLEARFASWHRVRGEPLAA